MARRPNVRTAPQYELQTFTEKRETSWAFTPYGGGDVDGPSNGPAPLPWDVEAHPAHMFHDEVKVVQVPHTASVKECHRCKGTGSLQCSECHGKGWVSAKRACVCLCMYVYICIS